MKDAVLRALKHQFGADRALDIYVFLHEYGLGLLTGVVLIAAIATYVATTRPHPHVHDAYISARLIGTAPLPSETGPQKTVLDLRLTDGSPLRLVTRNALLIGTLDEVCLERRRLVETGQPHYRVAPATRCSAP